MTQKQVKLLKSGTLNACTILNDALAGNSDLEMLLINCKLFSKLQSIYTDLFNIETDLIEKENV